jgi:glycosyltransferase involved in cell wall biosynthesis
VSNKINVYWVSPNLNHYKKRFLSHLVSDKNVELTILAGQTCEKEGFKDSKARTLLNIIEIPSIKRWFGVHPFVYIELFKAATSKNFDIIMMPSEKRFLLLIIWLVFLRNIYNFKLISYSHEIIRSHRGRITSLDFAITKWFFSLYDYIVFYTEWSEKWAIDKNLISNHKSTYANNTLDTNDIWHNYKFDINRQTRKRILFIGRLIKTKNLDTLLDYYYKLKEYNHGILLTIIGDGPDNAIVRRATERDLDIRWTGALADEALIAKEMKESHIVFIPGESGLSIVHAFSYGKPYVTFDAISLSHGPELSYLKDEVNGILLDSREEVDKNIARIESLLYDQEKYEYICRSAFQTAKEVSVEKWCKKMRHAFSHIKEIN